MTTKLAMRAGLGVLLAACLVLAGGCGGTKNVGTLGNFNIVMSGFTPHIGMTFYSRLRDTSKGTTVAISTPTVITGDGFSITFANTITTGHNYTYDFWVDVDGNGTLDHSPNGTPVGVDHSWRLTGAGTATGLALTFVHDTNWVDITPFP